MSYARIEARVRVHVDNIAAKGPDLCQVVASARACRVSNLVVTLIVARSWHCGEVLDRRDEYIKPTATDALGPGPYSKLKATGGRCHHALTVALQLKANL
jgi:hypothetical protein